jgi:hypothetical protein
MHYLATFIISALTIRWPLAGIVSFLLANTGMAGFFEQLGVLGGAVGSVRPDNLAIAVSIIVLLKRPPSLRVPETVTIAMWIVTCIVPVGAFFLSSTTYEFLASSWRALFWAPLFLALSRLSEKEWGLLWDLMIVLLAINGFLIFYIIHNVDYRLYLRLSTFRLSILVQDISTATFINRPDFTRLILPGTWTFGSLTILLCFYRMFSTIMSVKHCILYFLLHMCILYAIYFTQTRTNAIAISVSLIVMLFFVFLRIPFRHKLYTLGLIVAAYVAMFIVFSYYSGAFRTWQCRILGPTNEYNSLHFRLDSNLLYWNVLTHSYAIIGHPDFQEADNLVSGYNDVVAPLAMWWYYGLVSAICYSIILLYFAWHFARKVLSRAIPPKPCLSLIAMFGTFLAYLIESLSGAMPLLFDFPFTFSFVISSCAFTLFPRISSPNQHCRLLAMPQAQAVKY